MRNRRKQNRLPYKKDRKSIPDPSEQNQKYFKHESLDENDESSSKKDLVTKKGTTKKIQHNPDGRDEKEN